MDYQFAKCADGAEWVFVRISPDKMPLLTVIPYNLTYADGAYQKAVSILGDSPVRIAVVVAQINGRQISIGPILHLSGEDDFPILNCDSPEDITYSAVKRIDDAIHSFINDREQERAHAEDIAEQKLQDSQNNESPERHAAWMANNT